MKFPSRAHSFRRAYALRPMRSNLTQQGMLLIEAMCAILIFSFGVLGLIGLQASSIQQSTDAKYRTIAAELADQLVNQMWVSNRSASTYASTFESLFVSGGSPGTVYTKWLGSATTTGSVMGTLPGVTATANLPTVSFGAVYPSGCSTVSPVTCTVPVTVTMLWQSPKDLAAGVTHTYVLNAQVNLY